MKAAIYNPYLDTLGGGERYTLSFAKVLSEMGYEVDIAWNEASILGRLSKRFDLKLNDSIKVVKDINRGDGYDICFWVSDGSIPTLRGKRNFIHFQVPFKGVNGKSLLNKMKLFRVEKIICNSGFTKNIIDTEYGVESVVIYPPVDVVKIKPKRKQNLILYVGRFSNLAQNKGQSFLIKAFKELVSDEKYKDWKLVLAGGVEVGVGDYVKTLRKKANNYNIEFVTSPDYQSLIDQYGKAKIFWSAAGYAVDEQRHPERMEHFGISVVEAMAGGTIPIVYGGGGYKEIVDNEKNGFLWDNLTDLVDLTKQVVNESVKMRKVSQSAKQKSMVYSYKNFENKIANLVLKK